MRELTKTEISIKGLPAEVEGYVVYSVDYHYGEDADGNRGTAKVSVRSVEEITATFADDTEYNLTGSDLDRAEEALVETFLNS